MAKKKKKTTKDESTTELPKFGGFHPLASGLGGFKAKLDAEKAAEEARRKESGAKAPPPPPAPRRPEPIAKRNAATEKEDELTFHRMMSGVTPLEGESKRRIPVGDEARVAPARVRPEEVREKARVEAKEVLDHLHRLVDDPVRFEVTDDGKHVEGRRIDVPPSLVRELRRGTLPIDARLDLHGLGAEVAREKMLDFLRDKRTRGERCVLVIHGKGDSVPGGGVLRGEISAWLSQGRAREHVAAFATAREEDGGQGATYVALRR